MSKRSSESLYTADNFRSYIRAWSQVKGRGEYRRIAQNLKMHTTLLSQIIGGRKCLTEEQASKLCNYMGLNSLETDYFLKLVQLERAGTQDLRNNYQRHLKQLREQVSEIKSRVPEAKEMSEQDRATFYSSWQYSMIRLLTSIASFQTPLQISSYLKLSLSRVQEILDFLVSRGLCSKAPDGRYIRTKKNTHIEARSPLAIRHHQNWRTKSIEHIERMSPEALAFTAPVSLSKADFQKVRTILLETISEIAKTVEASASETVVYLGIDWIEV